MTVRLAAALTLLFAASATASDQEPPKNGISLFAGGAWMANLHNELRIGATDLQLSYRHDFAWSTLEAGAEWMTFFPHNKIDPAIGVRVGWGVRFTTGPVELRGGVSAGAYWTNASPVLPIGYLDLGVEKRFGAWIAGASVSGMYSLFGAGVQPRLFLVRTF